MLIVMQITLEPMKYKTADKQRVIWDLFIRGICDASLHHSIIVVWWVRETEQGDAG